MSDIPKPLLLEKGRPLLTHSLPPCRASLAGISALPSNPTLLLNLGPLANSLAAELPTPSVLSVLQTAAPSGFVSQIVNDPSYASSFEEAFASGSSPSWFNALPTDVKSYLHTYSGFGGLAGAAGAVKGAASSEATAASGSDTRGSGGSTGSAVGTTGGDEASGTGSETAAMSTGGATTEASGASSAASEQNSNSMMATSVANAASSAAGQPSSSTSAGDAPLARPTGYVGVAAAALLGFLGVAVGL